MTSVPIVGAGAFSPVSIISLTIPGLATTERLAVGWQASVTNQYSYNVGVGRYLTFASQPQYTAAGASSFWVTPAAMENVTPDRHHGLVAGSTSITAGDFISYDGDWCLNLCIYARATGQGGSDSLIIDGNGWMTVHRF
ncbi:hypothetical protein [Ferruginivarius sediminum]|uniref:hypothetical protein n=1 Tax=Ferruginivarius sediminum TaxID=2661937 RepID=UPI0011C03C6B|nr:hypothetical protein [Ferruginivarius sediminum]